MENSIDQKRHEVIDIASNNTYLQKSLYILALVVLFILFSIPSYSSENLLRVLLDRAAFFVAYYNLTFPVFSFFVWIKATTPQGFFGVDVNSIWYKFRVATFIGTNTAIYAVAAYYAYKLFISY